MRRAFFRALCWSNTTRPLLIWIGQTRWQTGGRLRFPVKLASSVDNLILPFRAKHPCPSILFFQSQNSFAPRIPTVPAQFANFLARVWYWTKIFHCLYSKQLIWGVWASATGHWSQFQVQVRASGEAAVYGNAQGRVNVRVSASSGSQVYISLLPRCPRNHLYTGEEDEKIIIIIAACMWRRKICEIYCQDFKANNGRTDFYIYSSARISQKHRSINLNS